MFIIQKLRKYLKVRKKSERIKQIRKQKESDIEIIKSIESFSLREPDKAYSLYKKGALVIDEYSDDIVTVGRLVSLTRQYGSVTGWSIKVLHTFDRTYFDEIEEIIEKNKKEKK